MKRILRRPAALAAMAMLAVAGGGVAYAATSGSNPRDALLSDAAKRLGVSPETLRSALKGAAADQLDQAVKDGRLTQQQANRIKAHIQRDGGGFPLFGGPPGPPGGGFGLHLAMPGVALGIGSDAAAKYLGLSPAELRRRLANGTSLADVAKAQGTSVSGLESALLADAKARLEQAVADGDLTAKQRDAIEQDLQQHVSDLVQGKGPRFGPGGPPRMGFRFHHGGFGPDDGFGPDGGFRPGG